MTTKTDIKGVENEDASKIVKKQPIRKRKILGIPQGKLHVEGKDENFVYYWAESSPDQPHRIGDMEAAGYTFVEYDEIGVNHSEMDATPGGNKVRVTSGRSHLYLMKKPKEWYDEDAKIKEEMNNDRLRALGLQKDAKLSLQATYDNPTI